MSYKFNIGQTLQVFKQTKDSGVVLGRDSYSPDDIHWYAVCVTDGSMAGEILPVREDLLQDGTKVPLTCEELLDVLGGNTDAE